jgi:HSP20 family molecular chaperone IbpA
MDDEWEWPEEKPSGSGYYNSAFNSKPPDPKRLATKVITEEEDPSQRVTMVRNYAWSDDTDMVRIYVPIPGVVRDQVSIDIGEDRVDLRAQTPQYGAFTMALRRLFDTVDVSKSTFKVLERKEKVVIALAKFPPPRFGEDSYVNFKPWYANPATPRLCTPARVQCRCPFPRQHTSDLYVRACIACAGTACTTMGVTISTCADSSRMRGSHAPQR